VPHAAGDVSEVNAKRFEEWSVGVMEYWSIGVLGLDASLITPIVTVVRIKLEEMRCSVGIDL
jgi:hypothetical protein